MKRKVKGAAAIALTDREIHVILVGLRLLLCGNVAAAIQPEIPIAETRALARRLTRTYATLTD
jgi:hypothetical protein